MKTPIKKPSKEMANVAIYLLILAQNNNIDIDETILGKIKKDAIKFSIKKLKNGIPFF